MIKGLHHNVYRCRDSEENRHFYEDFLGLPLVRTFHGKRTATGRAVSLLHTTYQLGENSFLEFFEVPGQPFAFTDRHDFDLHIALETDRETQARLMARAKAEGREVRGLSDHGSIESAYFRDPNGYVVELTVPKPEAARIPDPAANGARQILDEWQAAKG